MGSKFTLPRAWVREHPVEARQKLDGIWTQLFAEVFGCRRTGLNPAIFPIVEINARHTLREMVERHGRGDEYLSPLTLEGDAFDPQDPIVGDFLLWLQLVHDVAVRFRKKLIIKLPHRSDVFAYIKCAMWIRRVHLDSAAEEDRTFGVRALTLINTIKNPVWPVATLHQYSPAWYASPTAWNDAADKGAKYQMAGALLTAHRGQIVAPLLERKDKLGDLEIMIGGGITDHLSLDGCLGDSRSLSISVCDDKQRGSLVPRGAVQIGTWALLDMRIEKASWSLEANPAIPRAMEVLTDFELVGCRVCKCALKDQSKYIEWVADEKGTQHARLKGDCCLSVAEIRDHLHACKFHSIRLQRKTMDGNRGKGTTATNEILPRFAWLDPTQCRACGRCSKSFYCDSFLDRVHDNLVPVMEPRFCTGCGLCAQLCPNGAIHLYHPQEYLVLVSEKQDLHRALTAAGVPHMLFHTANDLHHIHMSDDLRDALTKGIMRNVADKELVKLLERIHDERILNDAHALGRGVGGQYPDVRRSSLLGPDGKFIGADLCTSVHTGMTESEMSAHISALLWSMIIWSDPGQVFWSSPIITESGGLGVVTHQGKVVSSCSVTDAGDLWEALQKFDCIGPVAAALQNRRSSVQKVPQ